MKKELRDHLLSVSGQQSVRAVALDAGIEPSTLNRQLAGEPKVQTVVAICRHYDAPFLPAFVAAGFITPAEASQMAGESQLSQVSDKALAEEILRRATAKPESELNEPVQTAKVVNFPR